MIEPLLVFCGALAAGLAAMPPCITFGDAGELSAAASVLGVAHAPGYPLYLLLAKAFGSALLLGNWAYRTNLASVACAAAALALLVDGLKRAGFSAASRWAAAALLAASPVWARELAATEVFALNTLFAAALAWVVCAFGPRLREPRPMAALGLLLGLGLSNHHTLILAVPAVGAALWAAVPASGGARAGAASLAIFFALGLLCYLYLPVSAARLPPLDWGHPTSVARFLHVLLRRDYGSLSLTVDGPGAQAGRWAQAARYAGFTAQNLGAGSALALLGFWAWPRLGPKSLDRRFPLLLLLAAGPGFLMLGNPGFDPQTSGALDRFYLASWIGLAMLAAAGVGWLERFRPRAAWVLAALPLAFVWGRTSRNDWAAYDYGRDVLRSLPRGSSLFMDGGDDTFYALAYLSYAEGRRPDLDLHDRGGLVYRNPYGPDFRGLNRQEKEGRRVLVESALAAQGRLYYSTLAPQILPGYRLAPAGLLKRAQASAGLPAAADPLWEIYAPRWDEGLLAAHYRDRALLAVYPFMRAQSLIAEGRPAAALPALRRALAVGADALWVKPDVSYTLSLVGYEATLRADWALAERAYELARPIVKGPDAELGLGVVYERTGRLAQAEEAYLKALRLAPAAPQTNFNLGSLYWAQKRWAEAASALERAAALNPSSASWSRLAAQARAKAAAAGKGT